MDLRQHLPSVRPEEVAQRLFHGRGHCFPGLETLTLDYLPPALLLTQFGPLTASQQHDLQDQLNQWWLDVAGTSPTLVWQNRSVSPARTELLSGTLPSPHWVSEGGLEYEITLMKGQNHGLFLDMAEGRQWVREHSDGKRVLNLFAYTCGFSVAARAGGADSVVNLDMSAPSLSQGKRNHARNGLGEGVRYLAHDLFKTFGKLRKLGPYDLVVVDPPSFQQGSFIATKDYPRLLRRLAALMAPEAEALLCLNAPELSLAFLQDQVAEFAPELHFVERLNNPASFPEQNPDKGLKVLRYRRVND
ncbi:class I SAM-dependent methyltransferase [Ferrimonas balearica]|uniref:class I SAM-dependent methyltransferase n=1 Tax=Ferrimonas balearica TaxID=44012 RepID=UPI001C992B3F|nr:class I SAM-dependent methyltransferase [Ferrimonas balearica]MBY5922176.1 class I SAM-dependent methyltransferase [Ferrimonas balearica]MBY5994484.1 class I SAM-dependent methyltransferase [Ferrimonas balearica]